MQLIRNLTHLTVSFVLSQTILASDLPLFTMGAIGDSVTSAVNSTDWGSQLQSSWSTGYDAEGVVDSHYLKLTRKFDTDIGSKNVARGGATATSLQEQVSELIPFNPDYVTMMIGGNDVCTWSRDYDRQLFAFEARVNAAVTRLIEHNDDIKILLVPIPNLISLWRLGRERNCQWLWDISGFCSDLLSDDRSDRDRLAFEQRLELANAALMSVADSHPDHIRFDPSIGAREFEWEHVSPRDCFHPSGPGQSMISDLTWDSGWFAD